MSRLQELVAEQRTSLNGEQLLSASDYLAMAKPIPSGDASPMERSSPQRAAEMPSKSAATDVVPANANSNDELMSVYRPGAPNRHLHIRETLLLALKVLEANQRDGFALLRDEQDLVNSIASFARQPSSPPAPLASGGATAGS